MPRHARACSMRARAQTRATLTRFGDGRACGNDRRPHSPSSSAWPSSTQNYVGRALVAPSSVLRESCQRGDAARQAADKLRHMRARPHTHAYLPCTPHIPSKNHVQCTAAAPLLHTFIHTRTHTHTHTHTHIHTYTSIHLSMSTYTHTYLCIYVYTYTHIYLSICVHSAQRRRCCYTLTHTHTHTHIHTFIHLSIYTHISIYRSIYRSIYSVLIGGVAAGHPRPWICCSLCLFCKWSCCRRRASLFLHYH